MPTTVPIPPPFPLFDHPSNIRWDLNQNLLVIHTFAVFFYFPSRSSKCSVRTHLYLSSSRYLTAHVFNKITELQFSCVLNFYVFKIYTYVYSRTQHALLRSFITWQQVSTPNVGHHQVVIQEHDCVQKLSTIKLEISPFYVKSTLKSI